MKKYKLHYIVISSITAIFLIINIAYYDIKNSENYYIFPNENELQIIHYDSYEYYSYNNNIILINETEKDFDEITDFLFFLINNNEIIFVVEFSDFDKQFITFKDNLDKNIINQMKYVHYIKYREIERYENSIIVQRFIRALRERKMSYFLFPDHENTAFLINEIKNELGNPVNIQNVTSKHPPKYIEIIGFFSTFVSLFYFIPFFGIIYVFVYFFFYNWSFAIAASFFSLIIYKKISKNNLFKIIYFSLLFGIFIYSSGYNYLLFNKLNNVRGVKILLVVLPLYIFITNIKKINFEKIKKSDIILIIFVLISGIYYLIRSSNFGVVLDLERKIRDSLERFLIARPRTKELISYFFYYTKPSNNRFIIWELARSLLSVSILDTFLHIHSPIYLGILRTFNSFIISVIILFVAFIIHSKIKRGDNN